LLLSSNSKTPSEATGFVITSADNDKLKTIRKLRQRRWRDKLGLFAAEGEDLVEAAAAAGRRPRFVLRAGEDVEPRLLDQVSALGSGSRVIGVYEQVWAEPAGLLAVWLHAVEDPGNVGTIVRAAHALADGPVVLGPGCADPHSPKAVRASMGSLFARPPARAAFHELEGIRLALSASAGRPLAEVAAGLTSDRVVLCLGAERAGMPDEVGADCDAVARIPLRPDGPDSLNVALAAAVALYEVGNRMAAHA
jgi:TrmH family RNA methyltransferase